VTKKTGELSTRAADLKRVAYLPGIRELLAVQQYVKLRGSFGASLVEKISPQDGRLHPSYNVASTKTGRASSNNPNIQQMPREQNAAGFRRCLTARPGSRLVVCDYGMMELRAAAYISGDTRMAADFAEGVDIHRQLAASTLGIPYAAVSKEQRQGAKPISFSTIFGAGPAGLVATAWSNYGVELSLDTAQLALTHFFNRYPQFAQWMRSHHQECQLNGLIRIGRLGRVIEAAWENPKVDTSSSYEDEDAEDPYVDMWDPGQVLTSYQPLAGEALKYTLACNRPIQGACADATMLALLGTDRALRAQAIDGGVVLCVHDELVLEVRAEQVATAAAILQHEMRLAFEQTFPGAPTTGLLECHSGGDWAAAKP
jgi:DNA polymerase I-like protein with 3'-5' exonuclease and polymerase domains